MEKEKKGIRCSYAVLVIILFAALAFVTDYAFIQNKMNKCNCPDCSLSGNTNVVNDGSIITNSDSSTTTEQKKVYTYNDLAGHYTVRYDSLDDGYGNTVSSIYHLYLYTDSTFYFTHSVHAIQGKIGTYTINGNNITLNIFLGHGSDIGTGSTAFLTENISFNDNFEISVNSPDGIEKQDVVLSKVEKYNDSNNESSLVRGRLNGSILYNEYERNNQ